MKRWIVLFLCLVESVWGRPVVMVTIEPYAYLVERVAGGLVEVKTVVPPSANAHLFEPTPRDLVAFKQAALWVRMGEGFENKLVGSLRKTNSSLTIYEAWQGLPLIAHHHEGEKRGCCGDWDRHVWLSPRMVGKMMPGIAEAVTSICPEQREEIARRLGDFMKELKAMDEGFAQLLASKEGKEILVAHPAFGYFCRDYGLAQLSIEQEGKDPLPKQLRTVFSQAKKQGHSLLFVEPQFSQRGAKQVADKLSLSLYSIDPYAYNYLDALKPFAQAIAKE